jgi:hypothetical protein
VKASGAGSSGKRWFGALSARRRFRLTLRGVLVTVGLVAGYAISLLIDDKLYLASGAVFVVLLVASLLEFVFADYLAEKRYPYDTERKLALLEERLGIKAVSALREKLERTISSFRACDKNCISGTVHVTVDLAASADSTERRGLMQLTDYIGSRGGQKGRITTLEKGIIGRCARTGTQEIVNFADDAEYLKRMVREFGFYAVEAQGHTRSARSYLAHPLLSSEGDAIGVLYFFSTEPQVFPVAARDADLEAVAKDVVGVLQTISMV